MRIAVIPARGGSKRIPRKNIKPFCGKPMIAWAIEEALDSDLFDQIIVSTDDIEIANVAKSFGATVPFIRPASLSGDFAGTVPVIDHAIHWMLSQNWTLDLVCCVYASPFIRQQDLRRGLDAMQSGPWQFAFSASQFDAPIFRSFSVLADGGVEMFFPEYFETRSQDLPSAMHDAGQFYWGRPAAWLENKMLFDKHSFAINLPSWRVQDIDTPDDWKRAELIAQVIDEKFSE